MPTTRRPFSLEAPDQPRLKLARAEIEAVLKKYDLAGVCALHTPGMVEVFYDLRPSYSCLWYDDETGYLRLRSKLQEDYGGDKVQQGLDQAATASMVHGLAMEVAKKGLMLMDMETFVDEKLRAEHVDLGRRPDPNEGRRQ